MVNERADIAADLRALAKLSQFSGQAVHLDSLSDEIIDNHSDSWMGINLVSAFPAGATAEPHRAHGAERWLSYVASFVIFLPIAWTWFSLHAAAAEYRSWINADRVGQNTFLSLWVTGFGGELSRWHTLPTVAAVSLGIILAAALLVVIQRSTVYQNQNTETQTYARLVTALVGAQRILNQRVTEDNTSGRASLRRAVDDLIKAHDKTQEYVSGLREAAGALATAATESLEPVLESLSRSSAELSATTAALKASTEGLSAAARSLTETTGETLSGFASRVGGELAAFRSGSAEVLETTAQTHAELLARAERSGTAVATAVTVLTQANVELTEALQQLPAENRTAAEPLQQAVGEFTDALTAWQTAINRHSDDLQDWTQASQHQVSEVTEATDGTRRILNDFVDRYAIARNGQSTGGV